MNPLHKYPFYIRTTGILLGLCLTILILNLGQQVFFPLLLALLIAILLIPIVSFFNRRLKFPYVLAVAIAVFLSITLLAAVVTFVSWQVGNVAHDWNKIKTNINLHYHHIQQWVNQRFHISYYEQNKYIKQATKDSMSNGSSAVTETLGSFTDALLNLILIPIYTFLLLLYKDLLIRFLFKIFSPQNHERLTDVLVNIKQAIRSYLTGLLTEMTIVATLTTVGFMIAGVQYALLLGAITGILNLIPYLGILIAGLLSIVATLSGSTDLSVIVSVVVVNVVVQFIDNNFLVPLVVSSKVKINALISIVSIIIGGAIAGVAGMFLAIPILAILKVIFDRVEFLEPWGYVMGDHSVAEKKPFKMKFALFKKKK